jgi:DNA gyrase subunit A
MSQDFYLQVPLVYGQGNMGSISGASPAAMRYTEVKLEKITDWLCLKGINRGAVPLIDNYDRTRKEPLILPVKLPMLLVNGVASGSIGVGFTSTFPTHNVEEVINASSYVLDCILANKEPIFKEIKKYINGPDFPTKGIVFKQELSDYLETGNGSFKVRGLIEKEKDLLIIKEIPYGVSSSKLISSIINAIDKEKITGIKDIRDEISLDQKTNKTKFRIVIELKRGIDQNEIIEQLYNFTDLQINFSSILTVIDEDNSIKVTNVIDIIKSWALFRIDSIRRQAQFEYNQLASKLHTIEGLIKVHPHINKIIEIIKSSSDEDVACKKLMKDLSVTSKQAKEIVKTRIGSLTKLKVDELVKEMKDIKEKLDINNKLITSNKEIVNLIKEDFKFILSNLDTKRKTKII